MLRPPLRFIDVLSAVAVSAALFALYSSTLCRTVPSGDSGELIAAAATLGIAHPPGYPLFTLLGKVATMIPIGTVAARVNALSALCQALAAGFVLITVRVLTGRLLAAVAAALAFGVASRVWQYATVAEVFALNDLFAAVLLAIVAAIWTRTEDAIRDQAPQRLRDGKLLASLALVFGVALTNQHTIGVVLGPGILAFLVLREMRIRASLATKSLTGSRIAAGIGLFALGLLPYAYLPIAASAQPALDWDHPTAFSRFLTLILRRDYGTLGLGLDAAGASTIGGIEHLGRALLAIGGDLAFVDLAVAVGGLLSLRRRHDGFVLFGSFLASLAGVVAFFLLVRTPAEPALFLGIVERFYLLPTVIVAVLAGVGLGAAVNRLPVMAGRVLAGVLAACTIAVAVNRFHGLDESQNRFTRVYASNLLASLEPRALLLSGGDLPYNALTYATLVEGERPDVRVIDQRLMSHDWYVTTQLHRFPDVSIPFAALTGRPSADLLALVDANASERPVAFYGPIEASWRRRYVTWPHGLVERVYPIESAPSLDEAEAAHDAVMATLDLSILKSSFDDTKFEALGALDHTYGDRVFAEHWIARARAATDPGERRAAFSRALSRASIAIERMPFDLDAERMVAQLALDPEVHELEVARRSLDRLREIARPGSRDREWADLMLSSSDTPR
ncbi:MAG: DUF2723 domain-containing protein [Planctomycetes bacterium]|nr:DUF2723 domain-containing protein [Planctomycetota bacterium]MBI3843654.1 DUF2723 domain-containing protein [Planctomycetota bacterium]